MIPSQTTQSQPSARDTARLIALIEREHVKAVFPESSMNARLAQTIARETGASADYTLYGDTLGPKGSAGATYLSMEAANANAMVAGFSGGRVRCTLPAAGMTAGDAVHEPLLAVEGPRRPTDGARPSFATSASTLRPR